MEQELIFGLDLGRLALLKKKLRAIMSNFRGHFFSFLHEQKNKEKHCNIRTKTLHKMKLKKINFL